MMLGHAVQAVARGWNVFPVKPGDKVPMPSVKWGQAANNLMPVTLAWWTRWPTANIGVACQPSGLLVVDCDKPKDGGGGPDGVDLLLDQYGHLGAADWFDTYTVKTGSGGLHLYFQWPQGVPASQSPLIKPTTPSRGHVDVRGPGGTDGGYVLGAGSVTSAECVDHPGTYTVEYDRPVADCPPALVQLIREKARPPAPPPRRPVQRETHGDGRDKFGGLAAGLANAQEGGRNAYLHWSACCMRDDNATLEDAMTVLAPAGEQAGLPYREIEATVRSAFRSR